MEHLLCTKFEDMMRARQSCPLLSQKAGKQGDERAGPSLLTMSRPTSAQSSVSDSGHFPQVGKGSDSRCLSLGPGLG